MYRDRLIDEARAEACRSECLSLSNCFFGHTEEGAARCHADCREMSL